MKTSSRIKYERLYTYSVSGYFSIRGYYRYLFVYLHIPYCLPFQIIIFFYKDILSKSIVLIIPVNKRWRIPKGQSKMDSPEKMKTNKKYNTQCVQHHYAQTNTNNVNKTDSRIFNPHMSWSFLFCPYWWDCLPSLFKLSFHNLDNYF